MDGKIKTEYKQDMVTLTADMDLNLAGPTINASAVAGHQGWLAGYQMAFDSSKSALTKNNFAVGFSNGDFTVCGSGQCFVGFGLQCCILQSCRLLARGKVLLAAGIHGVPGQTDEQGENAQHPVACHSKGRGEGSNRRRRCW